jgi:hypothetical protein
MLLILLSRGGCYTVHGEAAEVVSGGGVPWQNGSYSGHWRSKRVATARWMRGRGEVPTNCRRSVGMATLTELGRPRWHCDKLLTMAPVTPSVQTVPGGDEEGADCLGVARLAQR